MNIPKKDEKKKRVRKMTENFQVELGEYVK